MLSRGTSLVVQWLRLCASNSRGVGLILSLGTEIPHASGHNQSKKRSQEKSCLFPFAIIHILLLIFLISCPSYRPKYFKGGAASKLRYRLTPLTVCNLKVSWQWTMTSQFCIPVAIYHSYRWPDSIWCYWLQTSIWGRKKKKTTLFFLGPLQYSIVIWILSLPFLCLPLWFLPSCFLLGVAICSGSGLGGLCPGESRSLHASHTGLLFSFSITYSHLSPYSFYWSPCFWFPMSLPKTLLCLQRSPEQRAWASCIPTNKQMKYKPTLASAFPNCWSCNLRSSLAA